MKPSAAERRPAFNDRHFEAFFCCEKRGFAASRSSPYDRDLVFFTHNFINSTFPRKRRRYYFLRVAEYLEPKSRLGIVEETATS